jgi:microcystin degradation protein MlrC
VSDNTGGGAPGDATFILAELLRRGVTDAALACFYDPVAGADPMRRRRGRDPRPARRRQARADVGRPVDLRATVLRIVRGLTQRWGDSSNPIGDVAVIRAAASTSC